MVLDLLPRSVAARWSATLLDLRSVGARLRGQHPPPFHVRGGLPRGEAPPGRPAADAGAVRLPAGLTPRLLRIVETVAETPQAVRLVLEDPTGAPIHHRPGQFLTLSVEVGGVRHRRAYSIAWASADHRRVALGIKRVPGGVVSSHLVDTSRAGATLEVLGPSGDFSPGERDLGDLVLVAGGSGVTPLVRIAAWALAERPAARVGLVLGNRSAADVMFRREIEELSARFSERFAVLHVLDEGAERAADASSASNAPLAPLAGPLDRVALDRALRALPFDPAESTWFVCGPTPMMEEARALLDARGVERSKIREERFSRPELRVVESGASVAHPVTFRLRSGSRTVAPRPSATVSGVRGGA